MALRLLHLASAALGVGVAGCPAQDPDLRSKIQDALDMARPALIDHLDAASRSAARPGELALLVLAAIHDGVSVDDPSLGRAIKKLEKARPDQTYDLALRLLVLEACPTFPERDEVLKDDAKKLLDHLSDEGCFQYQRRPSTWDLSNTQYGALGLRAARGMGVKIPKRVWSKMAREVGDQQAPDGGFCYTRKRSGWDPYASMTAAGIAVLAVCRQALGDNHASANELQKQIDEGWRWFAYNGGAIGSTRERWSYYFHYGLERAAILCDVQKIGGKHDWYELGARMLVDEQLAGGGWSSTTDGFPGKRLSGKRGDAVPTAFAVLFLRRKFQKQVGPITARVVRLVNIGRHSKDDDVDACAAQLVARGKEAVPEVLEALRSELETQRRAAAQALEGLAGERFGFDPAATRDDNRRAVRRAELWWLKNR